MLYLTPPGEIKADFSEEKDIYIVRLNSGGGKGGWEKKSWDVCATSKRKPEYSPLRHVGPWTL